MVTKIIALDFDGVICDSAAECLVSAYRAFASARGVSLEPGAGTVPDRWREGFYRLRPFTRDGKDYLMVLHLLDIGASIHTQADFDSESDARIQDLLRIYGAGSARDLEARFQESRRAIRLRDEEAWMEMNPLYQGVAEALDRCRDGLESIYVTTFKPTDAAARILRHHRVPFPEGQILGGDKIGESADKNGHMERVHGMTSVPLEDIHYVDDQVSHLRAALGLGVRCYLATWGYNTDQQAEEARGLGIRLLAEAELPNWMEEVTQPG